MEEAKYIREADKSYMSFAIAKDKLLPQYHIKMISENYMEYIIQADTLDVNSELILNYNITSMRALSASIGKNMITSELIKNLIYDLKNMSKEITRYMLDINNICLDTDKIMADNIRGHFSFIYYPCENKTFIQSMQDLIDDLIQYVDYTDRISVENIYALYGVLRQPNCSFEDMLEVFNNAGINNSNNMVNNNINAMNNTNPYGGNNQGNNTEYCFNNAGANMNSNNIDNSRTGYNDNNSNNSNIYNNTNNSYNNNSCNNTSYNNSTYNNLNTQYNNTYNNTSYSDDNNNYNANIYSNDDIYNSINEENNNSHNKKSLKDRFLKNKSKKESNNKAQTDMQSQYGTAQPQQNNINAVTDMQNVDTATSGRIPPTFIISVIVLISSVIAAIVIKAYMPRKICLVAAIISAALMVLIYRKNEDAIKHYKIGNRTKNKAGKNKENNNDNNNSYNDMYNNNDWYNNLNNGIDNNTFANNCNNSEYVSAYNSSDNNQTFNNNYTNAGMSQNNNYTNAGMSQNNNYTNAGMSQNNNYTNAGMSQNNNYTNAGMSQNNNYTNTGMPQNNNIDNQNMSNNYGYDNMPSYEQTTVLREEGTTVLNDCISHVFKESYLEYIDDNERQIYGGNITIRQDNMLIGSSNICDYVIDNPAISRNHARISRIGDKYYMTDLDSTNGTFINGIRMNKSETKELNNGEEVMIGRIKFRFVCN